MLRHLRVTNFAILSDVAIELGHGLNVLTGETGAGKSLIVEAVNLLRGGRASADIPRAGADEAVVEAIVEVPPDLRARVSSVLDGAGLPPNEDGEHEVFIRRVIQRGGRSRTYVNGALTTAGRLAELGALLIDLSGQHEHQGLVDPARHLDLIDAFARTAQSDAHALLSTMTAAWDELRACDAELAALGGDERERESRIDYLRYQLEELDSAALQPGEDVSIEVERARLASVDQLQSAARRAESLLYGDDSSDSTGARDAVAAAARELERVTRVDASLEPIARQCTEIEALIDDAASELRAYSDKLEGDPERLAYLDDRLALIRRLVRKHAAASSTNSNTKNTGGHSYSTVNISSTKGTNTTSTSGTGTKTSNSINHNGPSADNTNSTTDMATGLAMVLGKASQLRAELDALTGRDDLLAQLASRRTKAETSALSAAAALTKSRAKAARKLEKDVASSLAELGMSSAVLTVVVEPRPLGPTGADRIELMLASNKGEDTRPLAKIASGGELSRIMLALKLALRRADEVATYVFDEVDTGIGGATAQVVGAQIRTIASPHAVPAGSASNDAGRQVLCVTHLPQIAAYADHHFHVEKTEIAGRTETHVRKLNAAARKDELARMLGGHATSKARAHAAELLAEAARTEPVAPPASSRTKKSTPAARA
jgi:DNA repair protein RecN (Recombination protein N)